MLKEYFIYCSQEILLRQLIVWLSPISSCNDFIAWQWFIAYWLSFGYTTITFLIAEGSMPWLNQSLCLYEALLTSRSFKDWCKGERYHGEVGVVLISDMLLLQQAEHKVDVTQLEAQFQNSPHSQRGKVNNYICSYWCIYHNTGLVILPVQKTSEMSSCGNYCFINYTIYCSYFTQVGSPILLTELIGMNHGVSGLGICKSVRTTELFLACG